MSDRELLELAAKAIGYEFKFNLANAGQLFKNEEYVKFWNPIKYNDDAFVLAVKLRLQIQINDASVVVDFPQNDAGVTRESLYQYPDSKCDTDYNIVHINHEKATRRAIVRTAAEIGRSLP